MEIDVSKMTIPAAPAPEAAAPAPAPEAAAPAPAPEAAAPAPAPEAQEFEFVPLGEDDLPPVDLPPSPAPEPEPAVDEPKRGRGRPPGRKNSPRPPDLSGGAEPAENCAAVAGMTFDLSTGILATSLSPAWLAKDKSERDFVVGAIARYYESEGVSDIPPRTALLLAVCAYSLPRLAEPQTKDKLKAIWFWSKSKISGVFRRK